MSTIEVRKGHESIIFFAATQERPGGAGLLPRNWQPW